MMKFKAVNTLGQSMCRYCSQLCVQYKVDEWVEAPVGGLFVFDNIVALESSVKQLGWHCLAYNCEVEDQIPLPEYMFDMMPVIQYSESNLIGHLKNYWAGDDLCVSYNLWSPGTEAYRRVKLVGKPTEYYGVL
jgi:hypothetical protein